MNFQPLQFINPEELKDLILENSQNKDFIVIDLRGDQRGPTCATRLLARRSLMGPEDAPPPTTPEICVLRGGWERFAQLYSEDTRLCEGTT
mmetsp:Transcript_22461/g.29135  ORF Transcript_22461/g.29135 Transcript_22461/m.29135 type:complete len:91 (-) Transcript_22461:460-732(-)